MTKNPPSAAALRSRLKRSAYLKQPRKMWTSEEKETLLLHLECFGKNWPLIGRSMRRSVDSVQKCAERVVGVEALKELFPEQQLTASPAEKATPDAATQRIMIAVQEEQLREFPENPQMHLPVSQAEKEQLRELREFPENPQMHLPLS
jgi:hypothetical protein